MWGRVALGFVLCFPPSLTIAASFGLDASQSQVILVGQIVPGDFDRFANLLRRSTTNIDSVDVVSPGGNVQEALKIGRLIRSLSFQVNAPSSEAFAPEAHALMCGDAARLNSSVGCSCASACFLIWTAGVMRSGDEVYIHRIAFDKRFYGSLSPTAAHLKYEGGLQEVHTYLREMEIPDSIYESMVNMPSYGITKLEGADSMWTPPSFGEWLTARCGPPRTNSMCELTEFRNAAATALAKFRSGD
jgi:hypothetical protein